MADRFPALGQLNEADFDRLKAGVLKRLDAANPASLKRDLLQMIREDFEEHGRTEICIRGKAWEFVARQPGVPYAHWRADAPSRRLY